MEGGGLTVPLPALVPDQDLAARWTSFADFRATVRESVHSLEAERLYDPRLEGAHETAKRYEGLFKSK